MATMSQNAQTDRVVESNIPTQTKISKAVKSSVRTIQAAAILALTTTASLDAASGPEPWTWRAPLPQGNSLNDAAYSPTLDITVAVGDQSAVMTKTGNGTWTASTFSAASNGLAAITWTGDRFVAAGGSITDGFFQSADGVTWTFIPGTTDSGPSISQMASGSNATVALTWGGTAWVSNNRGATWTKKALPAIKVNGYNVTYNSLASNGSRFVAVSSGGTIMTSPDGAVWTKAISGTTAVLTSIASNGSGFIAVGSGWNSTTNKSENVILKSPDGVTWSPGAFPPPDQWGNPRYFYNGVFVHGAGYIASSVGEFFTSPDGQTWTSVGSPVFAVAGYSSSDFNAASPTASGSATLLVGHGGLVASFDGTVFQTEITGYLGGYLWGGRLSAAGLDGLFLAVDNNGSGRLIESSDGATFSATASAVTAVARVGDTLVKFADGSFESTTDGTTWTPLGSGTFEGMVSSFAGQTPGPAVVVTKEDNYDQITRQSTTTFRLYSSADWATWTAVTTPSGFSVSYSYSDYATPQVQWDGTRFVLLSPNGRLSTSANGQTWTTLPALPNDTAAYLLSSHYATGAPAANLVASFASNGTTIVARSGKLQWSQLNTNGPDRFFVFSNGAWKQAQPVEYGWTYDQNVVWTGSVFASANSEGKLNTSPDGVNWTRRELGAKVSQLVWTGGQLVGITDKFGFLTHPDGLSPLPPGPFTDISPASATASSAGEVIPVTVTSNQKWKVVEALAWVSASPLSGENNGPVQLTVAANTTPLARTGTVTIGGRSITINQASFISTSSPAQSVGYNGTTYTVDVASTLPWKITNPASTWVTANATSIPMNGTVPAGNATVTFTVKPQPNANPTVRTAVVSLGGVPHTITQEAAPRTLIGNTGTFTIPVAAKSEWTATSNATWTLLSKSSGTGAGSVVVNLSENPTTSPRTANLLVNGLNYVVTQQGQTLPLLHKGTYTGLAFTGTEPALSNGTTSVFGGITDAMGGITVTMTPTTTGNATYTSALRLNGLTYTGRGSVNTSAVPWTISGNWTAPTKPVSTAAISLNFVVDSQNTKLLRGTAVAGSGINYGLLASKPVFDGRSAIFPDAGSCVAMIGQVWPAATSISINAAGMATCAGKFVDGTPLTMSVPVFGATGLDGEWGFLFFNSIYGTKGTLGGYYYQSPDPAAQETILASGLTTAWVPARPELPSTDPSGKLADDSAQFLPSRYIKPATGQPAVIWTSGNSTTSYGLIDVPAVSPYPDMISGRVNLLNKTNVLSWDTATAPNSYKAAATFNSANGLLEGSFTIPVSHPEDPDKSLGTRVVKFYGIANQDYDNFRANDGFRAFFLSPTIKVGTLTPPGPSAETIGAVGELRITPVIAP